MNLKKNDKIILIIGVVVLLISGIGITLYTAPDNEENVGEAGSEYMSYSYTWTQDTGEQSIDEDFFVEKGTTLEQSITVSGRSNIIITNVEFKLNWEDDVTYGLIMKKGLDTLTAEMSHGSEIKTDSSEGEGNYSFVFTVNERPKDGTIEATSLSDAQDTIDELTSGKNKADFDLTVTVDTGERIFRLLKYIRDKGNDFELTATYTYYTCSLQESEPPIDDSGSDDTKTTGDDGFDHNVGEFYVNLGYGRGMI
jgi:hypothetical protein